MTKKASYKIVYGKLLCGTVGLGSGVTAVVQVATTTVDLIPGPGTLHVLGAGKKKQSKNYVWYHSSMYLVYAEKNKIYV